RSARGTRVRPPAREGSAPPCLTVIGVVDDVKNGGIDKPAGTELYFALPQSTGTTFALRTAFLAVTTRVEPMSTGSRMRSRVRMLERSLPIANIRSMDEIIATAESRPRFLTLLLTV